MRTLLTLAAFLFTLESIASSPFPMKAISIKRELMKVFYSAKLDDYNSITKTNVFVTNFENFSDANASTIVIPDTKYSIVYSLGKDRKGWSTVINEWEEYNQDVAERYTEYEQLLKSMFNIDNGWVVFEMKVNKSDEKSDLIFSKPGYGYITLDYSKNVTGKCALQLRVNPKVDEIKEIRAELEQLNDMVLAR